MVTVRDFIEDEIDKLGLEMTNEAIEYLKSGYARYTDQCMTILKRKPTKIEALNVIRSLFSTISTHGELITINELKGRCDQLPYPFNQWFC